MQSQIEGKEDLLSEQAAEMLGQKDIFTMAAIQSQLKNMDEQFEGWSRLASLRRSRLYMGTIGFRIIISIHGEVLEIVQRDCG